MINQINCTFSDRIFFNEKNFTQYFEHSMHWQYYNKSCHFGLKLQSKIFKTNSNSIFEINFSLVLEKFKSKT
jgi:hypothetical protein